MVDTMGLFFCHCHAETRGLWLYSCTGGSRRIGLRVPHFEPTLQCRHRFDRSMNCDVITLLGCDEVHSTLLAYGCDEVTSHAEH